jgi:hypothetical protein
MTQRNDSAQRMNAMTECDDRMRLQASTTHQSTSSRSILLYNPISGHGHLDSWNALFVSFLLEAGWYVTSLSPGAADLQNRLTQKKLATHPNLRILEWRTPKRRLSERIRAKLVRMFQKSLQALSQPVVNELEASYLQPQEFAQRVQDAFLQLKSGSRRQAINPPEFVFNMYMDLYRPDELGWAPFAQVNKLPWAGIRFVPSPVLDATTDAPLQPTEAYYQLPSLAGMCFLDEPLCQQYVERLPQKAFGYLPDITETSLPAQQSEVVTEIKRRAAGRKIVFLGGTIGRNKNLSRWFELIALANPRQWFFVQIGEVHEQNLSAADLAGYQQALKEMPEHVYIKTEYLPDERVFNEVIAASDILFAVYRKFSISSNMPGKAAAFEKPILVAEGYLMAERVNQYQIGLSVPEEDPKQMLEALEALAAPLEARTKGRTEHFAAYRRDFSHEALKARFFAFLEKAMAVKTAPELRRA